MMKSVVVAVIAISGPVAAQWANYPTPGIPRAAGGTPNLAAPAPRTADGKPDLSGLWDKISPRYGRNIAADLKPGEVQPWAEELVQRRMEDFGKESMGHLCLPLGPAYITNGGSTAAGMMKIIQTPTLIVFLSPDMTYRQIFLDGRALEADPNPSWMGYSVGHWEGETLVVESNGYNDRTWLLGGFPHTEALRMTERFRRTDFGHLEVAVSFDDPKAYNKPWTFRLSARLAADTEPMEAVCNERPDNGQEHWIGRTSDAQKSAVKVAPEVLAKYVGVYKGIYLRNPRTVEVTFSGGTLSVSVNGGPKQSIFPQSET